jgi:GTPase Era involved in 16S rRNA processing
MFPVNIVIIGGVSVGKSTIVNTLLLGQYSDTNRKRTTALPQIYSCGLEEKADDIKSVRSANKTSNDTIMNNNTIANITPLMYNVPALEGLVVPDRVYIKLHDTPGLNDSVNKEQYYKYITDMFPQYSIILYIVDINSAINTSDEIDILNILVGNMSSNHEKGIKTKLIVVINKCDDMDSNFILQDEELKTMEQQLMKFVLNKTREYKIESKHISFVKMSGEDAFVYRSLKKDINAVIDDKYKDKFGINEFGKKKWGGFSAEMKRNKLRNTLADLDITQCLRQTGFSVMLDIINTILLPSQIYEHIWSYHYFNMQNELGLKSTVFILRISTTLLPMYEKYKRISDSLTEVKRNTHENTRIKTSFESHIKNYVDRILWRYSKSINSIVGKYNYEVSKNICNQLKTIPIGYRPLNTIDTLTTKLVNYIVEDSNNSNIGISQILFHIEKLIEFKEEKHVDTILSKLKSYDWSGYTWPEYEIDDGNNHHHILRLINKYKQGIIQTSAIIFTNVRIGMNRYLLNLRIDEDTYRRIDELELIIALINYGDVKLEKYLSRYLEVLKVKAYTNQNTAMLVNHIDNACDFTANPNRYIMLKALIQM